MSSTLQSIDMKEIRQIMRPVKDDLKQFFTHEGKGDTPAFGYPLISFSSRGTQVADPYSYDENQVFTRNNDRYLRVKKMKYLSPEQ